MTSTKTHLPDMTLSKKPETARYIAYDSVYRKFKAMGIETMSPRSAHIREETSKW